MENEVDLYPMVWRWKIRLPDRYGQSCRVVLEILKTNSVLVEFKDEFLVNTSRYAVIPKRKLKGFFRK